MAITAAHAADQVRKRTRRTVAVVLAVMMSLGGVVLPAGAVQGRFNAQDGLLDRGTFSRTDLVKSNADNSFANGAKEGDLCPAVETGGIPPSKDDFSNFYASLDGNILYLAFRRSDNNGTATVDFELNQSTLDCGNGVNKVRTEGDLLITYDFQGGDLANVPIQIRTWTGTMWSEPVLLTITQAQASISPDLLFGELTIDLLAAGIFTAGECVSFASAFAKSRSSNSFTSTLKDFVAPIPISISNCASITVVKEASPEGATPFGFTFDPPGVASSTTFSLIDDGSSTTPDVTPDRKTFADLTDVNGTYVITETDPDVTPGAWDLTAINCVGGSATYNVASNTVSVVPGGPVNVTCTFSNTFDPPPTVSVLKTAQPSSIPEPGGEVVFDVVVTNTSNEPVTLTTLTDTVGGTVLNLNGRGTCLIGAVLAPASATSTADTYTCSFPLNVTGNAGNTRTDVVDAIVTDAEGDTATDNDDAVVTLTDVLPTISVTKTANVTSLLEPGGDVTYTVVVTNLSNESVTLRELIDTVGTSAAVNLFGRTGSTCVDDRLLTAADSDPNGGGDTYTCTFTRAVIGDTGTVHTNVVQATAYDDDGSPATASDTERVVITNVLPTVSVVKSTPTPTINEPGAVVRYNVVVNNLSNEAVTLTELTDTIGTVTQDVFGIPGTTCRLGAPLAAASLTSTADTYTCYFELRVTGNAGSTHDNTVTAVVIDNELSPARATDIERVTITNVAPTILVTKTASPLTLPETGGQATYTVVVQNLSIEPVTITSLVDVAGTPPTSSNLATRGTCRTSIGTVLAVGASYTCTFTAPLIGNAGTSHVNVVTAIAIDDDGSSATDDDDAVVRFTDVAPTISVLKTANPTSLPEPGGAVTYTVRVTNLSAEAVTVTDLVDQVGASAPVNLFGRAGSTCDDNQLLTAADGIVNGGGDTYTCTFTGVVIGDAGFVHTNVVTATAVDDELNQVMASDTEDVRITDVAPAISVVKSTATPSISEPGAVVTYTVVVNNLSAERVTLTTLTDTIGGVTQNVFAIPGTTCLLGVSLEAASLLGTDDTYTCTFPLQVSGNAGSIHDDLVRAVVVDNELTPAENTDTERVTITNVAPTISVLKTASPLTVPEPSGTVTYTVVVRNLSNEPVTLTTLTDTVGAAAAVNLFTLTGSTCTSGQVLTASDGVAGGTDTYTCTFTAVVSGDGGSTHVNVVRAIVVDDDNSTATASDDAIVTVSDVLPGINIVKTASPTIIRAGDTVTYTYAVTTTTQESLSDVKVTDDKCSPVTFVSGDTDGDRLLDAGETWNFRCTSVLTVDTVNVATATGTDSEGNKTTDTDTASVDVTNPAIAVDKTADRTTATSGENITYTYVVTNPGDGPLKPVTAVDDKCSPLTFVSGDTDGDGALDTGERWRYTCSVVASTTAGDLVNVVVVTGTPTVGPAVTGRDTATVRIAPVEVAGVVLTPPAPAAVAAVELPRTGSDVGGLIQFSLALLGLGGMSMMPEHLRRRRRIDFIDIGDRLTGF